MSLKLFLPFDQSVDDDQVLGESGADSMISDGADRGLHFTADDWQSIIEALYGVEANDGLIAVSDDAKA